MAHSSLLLQKWAVQVKKLPESFEELEEWIVAEGMSDLPEEEFNFIVQQHVRRINGLKQKEARKSAGYVPGDLDELVQLYESVLSQAGAKDPLNLAARFVSRGYLKKAPRKNFLKYLVKKVSRILEEDAASAFEYPSTLPRDEGEMYSRYRKMVNSSIRRVISWGLESDDTEQEIWTKLLASNLLQKYVSKAIFDRLPSSMTVCEAQDYLGVTDDQWHARMSQPGAPTPLQGDWRGDATYRKDDILALDNDTDFPSRPLPRVLPDYATDVKKFEGYLRAAAQNHSRNMLRTNERRFQKDAPMRNPHVFLASGGGSHHVVYSDSEARETWESSLVSDGPSVEDSCDAMALAENLTNMGVHDYEGYQEALSNLAKQARRAGFDLNSDDAASFVQAVSEGQDPSEAMASIHRMKVKVRLNTVSA